MRLVQRAPPPPLRVVFRPTPPGAARLLGVLPQGVPRAAVRAWEESLPLPAAATATAGSSVSFGAAPSTALAAVLAAAQQARAAFDKHAAAHPLDGAAALRVAARQRPSPGEAPAPIDPRIQALREFRSAAARRVLLAAHLSAEGRVEPLPLRRGSHAQPQHAGRNDAPPSLVAAVLAAAQRARMGHRANTLRMGDAQVVLSGRREGFVPRVGRKLSSLNAMPPVVQSFEAVAAVAAVGGVRVGVPRPPPGKKPGVPFNLTAI